MSARRRRVGSESEPTPLIAITSDGTKLTDPYDRHEGKLKNYSHQNQLPLTSSPTSLPLKKQDIAIMTARDRTMEFTRAIQSLQSRNITRAVNLRDPRKANYMQSHAEFMMIARTIGKNVAGTYTKLEKLTLLARNMSPFADGPNNIAELTYIIKEDINSLNQQIAKLQEVSRKQKQFSKSGRHLLSHSSNIVLALQSKLATMSNEFKQVLEVRTEVKQFLYTKQIDKNKNLKLKKTRQEKFDASDIVAARGSKKQKGSLLNNDDDVAIDFGSQQSAMVPLLQSQQQMPYDQTDDYLQSRADTMQNIESTIVELGGIFQQLAHMVEEQREMVDRIDGNVESASLNVEAAHNEILKYFQSVTSNRWLMIKIFGVLIFFFLFFVVFLT